MRFFRALLALGSLDIAHVAPTSEPAFRQAVIIDRQEFIVLGCYRICNSPIRFLLSTVRTGCSTLDLDLHSGIISQTRKNVNPKSFRCHMHQKDH